MNIFEKLEVGQVLKDIDMGCEWIIRERIPGGVRLQLNKKGGPYVDATPDSCFMSFTIETFFYELTMRDQTTLCICGAREPSPKEATAFVRKACNQIGNTTEVVSVERIDDFTAAKYDLSDLNSWAIFGLSPDFYPIGGRRIWNRDYTEQGKITVRGRRYCAACQRVHDCYVVKWPNGKSTKPCAAGVELLPNGTMHIM